MKNDQIFSFIYHYKYVMGLTYAFLIYILAYFQYAMKGKYKKIYKEFKNEPRLRRIVGNIIATFYFFGSFWFSLWMAGLSKSLIK